MNLEAPVYYPLSITIVGASTPSGALSCTTYPVVQVRVTHSGGGDALVGSVTTSSDSQWSVTPLITSFVAGDTIYAKMTTVGVGCTNEIPLLHCRKLQT